MKRVKLILIFIAASTTTAFTQVYTSYGNYNSSHNVRSDIHEIRVFERELDQFSYALMIGDRITAIHAKNHILEDMEREIRETAAKLNALDMLLESNSQNVRERNAFRSGRIQSRKNGVLQEKQEIRREIQIVNQRLEKQERLYIRFDDLQLIHRRRGLINENEHRRIMYEFKETMRDDLVETR